MNNMLTIPVRITLGAIAALNLVLSASAEVQPFPPGFHTQEIKTDGVTIHVRVGGKGPAVVMLHGFADTGDMWAPLATAMMNDHTVIVPDLRGMGLSSYPEAGYDKKTQANDIARVMDHAEVGRAPLIGVSIGGYTLFQFWRTYRGRVAALGVPTWKTSGNASSSPALNTSRTRPSGVCTLNHSVSIGICAQVPQAG